MIKMFLIDFEESLRDGFVFFYLKSCESEVGVHNKIIYYFFNLNHDTKIPFNAESGSTSSIKSSFFFQCFFKIRE